MTPSPIKISKLSDRCILVEPTIDILRATAYDFYHQIQAVVVEDMYHVNVIIDLSRVNYVDSTFWSRIISLVQRVNRIVFVGLKVPSLKNFYSLGISTVCELAESVEAAQKLVAKPKR